MSGFALFAGDDHYPCGGMEDFQGRFESFAAAREFLASGIDSDGEEFDYDWYQIVDLASFEVVDRG